MDSQVPLTKNNGGIDFKTHFLTPEEHLTIRTLSQILSQTETLQRDKVAQPPCKWPNDTVAAIFSGFLKILDPGSSKGIALMPGAHCNGAIELLCAVSEDNTTHTTARSEPNGLLSTDDHGPTWTVKFDRREVSSCAAKYPFTTLVKLSERYENKIPWPLLAQLAVASLKDGHEAREEAHVHAYRRFARLAVVFGLDRLSASLSQGEHPRDFINYITLMEWMEMSFEADEQLTEDVTARENWNPGQVLCWQLFATSRTITRHQLMQHRSFDRPTRRLFLKLLSKLIEGIRNKICTAKRMWPPTKMHSDFYRQNCGETLDKLVEDLELICAFLTYFGREVLATLRWLARLCNIRSTAVEYISNPTSETSSLSLHDDMVRMREIDEDPNRGWARACLEWLHSLAREFDAIQVVHPHAPRLCRSLNLAHWQKVLYPKIQLRLIDVECSSPAEQTRMLDVGEALDTIRAPQPSLLESFRVWLDDSVSKEALSPTNFRGTIHSECILLTLHALTLDFAFSPHLYVPGPFGPPSLVPKRTSTPVKAPNPDAISACLAQQGISLPADVIRSFSHATDLLAMSERSCPACRVVLSCLTTSRRAAKNRAGRESAPFKRNTTFYPRWVPVSLPPWTPRMIGEKVLDAMRSEIMKRANVVASETERDSDEE